MGQKIGLLITGCYADFYASMKAMQVADRTDAKIHVMQLTENTTDCSDRKKKMSPEEVSDLIGLISWLCEIEKISVSFHIFGTETEIGLPEFLRDNEITCLVAGSYDQKNMQQKYQWLQTLQDQLGADRLWFQRSFQVLITLPWDDVPFNRAIQQLGYNKTNRSAGLTAWKSAS
jgi:hypothetical protein